MSKTLVLLSRGSWGPVDILVAATVLAAYSVFRVSARVACVAAEVTRCLGRIFPVHVSRVLRSRHTCCGCLLSWLSGSFRRHLWAANVCHSM